MTSSCSTTVTIFASSSPTAHEIHVGAFTGNFAIQLRALAYILSLGKENIKWVGPLATLNANYVKESLKDAYESAYLRTASMSLCSMD